MSECVCILLYLIVFIPMTSEVLGRGKLINKLTTLHRSPPQSDVELILLRALVAYVVGLVPNEDVALVVLIGLAGVDKVREDLGCGPVVLGLYLGGSEGVTQGLSPPRNLLLHPLIHLGGQAVGLDLSPGPPSLLAEGAECCCVTFLSYTIEVVSIDNRV